MAGPGPAFETPRIRDRTSGRLAIGNPADGQTAAQALIGTGGAGASVSDAQLVEGIRILAETTGIFAETAGGVTVASALELARRGHFKPSDEVVLCITGNGLKTADAVGESLQLTEAIAPRLKEVERLVAARD